MSPASSIPPEKEAIAQFLWQCLEKRLPSTALDWLADKRRQIRQDAAPFPLYTAFSAAPRMVGKAALELDEAELLQADATRRLWKPGHWSADQAARCLLLLDCDDTNADAGASHDASRYCAVVEKLFSTADARELVALYQALPLLPHPDQFRARAAEGVRSNMVNVFHAIALNNPYPLECFNEPAWNQMVLKVAFIGSPMREVIGLGARANPKLARMLHDFVHERRAAGRGFPAEVWPLMAPYADEETIKDFYLALEDKDEAQRVAASAALERATCSARAGNPGMPGARR